MTERIIRPTRVTEWIIFSTQVTDWIILPVYEWVNELLSQYTSDWIVWMNFPLSSWETKWIILSVHDWMNYPLNEWLNELSTFYSIILRLND